MDLLSQECSSLRIIHVKQSSPDVFNLETSAGTFFLRSTYFEICNPENLKEGSCFSEEYLEDLLQAGFCYIAEKKALEYLNRAEHSAFLLKNKLLTKGFLSEHIDKALKYLTEQNLLSDKRYADAFLRNRSIRHYEGKTRLLQELAARGISKNISEAAVNEFFEDNDEILILKKAVTKLKKTGTNDEKLKQRLLKNGFSWKQIEKNI